MISKEYMSSLFVSPILKSASAFFTASAPFVELTHLPLCIRAQPTRAVLGGHRRPPAVGVIIAVGINAVLSAELAINTVLMLRVFGQAAISIAFPGEIPMNPASFISTVRLAKLTDSHL